VVVDSGAFIIAHLGCRKSSLSSCLPSGCLSAPVLSLCGLGRVGVWSFLGSGRLVLLSLADSHVTKALRSASVSGLPTPASPWSSPPPRTVEASIMCMTGFFHPPDDSQPLLSYRAQERRQRLLYRPFPRLLSGWRGGSLFPPPEPRSHSRRSSVCVGV